ncbi:MAG: hypothetical protein AAGB51_03085 [Planctomycetota bacterium]
MNSKTIRTTTAAAMIALAGGFLALAPAASAIAVTQDLPSGEQVVARYVEATGGEKAHRAITSRTMVVEMSAPQFGKMTITTKEMAPNMLSAVIKSDQFGEIIQGTNGEVAWASDVMQGPRVLEGDELTMTIREADFYGDLNTNKYFSKIETLGKQEFGEGEVYQVAFTPLDGGNNETRYYDTESGLLVGSEGVMPSPQGELTVTTVFSDYRDVDGIKIPFKSERTMFGMTQTLTVQSVTHNEGVTKDDFEVPEDIKPLLED